MDRKAVNDGPKKGTRQIDVKISPSEGANGRFGTFSKTFLLSSMYPNESPRAYVFTRVALGARFTGKYRKTLLNPNVFARTCHRHSALLSV